jgi:tripartite-type tricarboxylate transporter receptor subunit TctC
MRSPEAQLRLNKIGGRAKLGSPQDFEAFIVAETQRWSAIIEAAGVKMD